MKISQALSKKNDLQKKLVRLIDIRKDNFNVIIKKDETLDKARKLFKERKIADFFEVTEKVKSLKGRITDLRERILNTNINTFVEVNGEKTSLSRLFLLIGNIKSDLKELESINARGFLSSRSRKISTTKEEEKEVEQLSDLELEEMKSAHEDEKTELQNLLEFSNANTELLE